jgi:hypothetical protein
MPWLTEPGVPLCWSLEGVNKLHRGPAPRWADACAACSSGSTDGRFFAQKPACVATCDRKEKGPVQILRGTRDRATDAFSPFLFFSRNRSCTMMAAGCMQPGSNLGPESAAH